MSATTSLQARLKEISNTLGQTQVLLDRLRNFTPSIGQGNEARVELGAEIHDQLKAAEAELELLNGEIYTPDPSSDGRRKSAVNGDKETERERVKAVAERLAVDLKTYVTALPFCSAEFNCIGREYVVARHDADFLQNS